MNTAAAAASTLRARRSATREETRDGEDEKAPTMVGLRRSDTAYATPEATRAGAGSRASKTAPLSTSETPEAMTPPTPAVIKLADALFESWPDFSQDEAKRMDAGKKHALVVEGIFAEINRMRDEDGSTITLADVYCEFMQNPALGDIRLTPRDERASP